MQWKQIVVLFILEAFNMSIPWHHNSGHRFLVVDSLGFKPADMGGALNHLIQIVALGCSSQAAHVMEYRRY